MSIATKVAIQLNCKIGGTPWSIEIPIQVSNTKFNFSMNTFNNKIAKFE